MKMPNMPPPPQPRVWPPARIPDPPVYSPGRRFREWASRMSQKLIGNGSYKLEAEIIKGCLNYIFVNNSDKSVSETGEVDKKSWDAMKPSWHYIAGGFKEQPKQ